MKAQSPQGGRIINNGSISAHMRRGPGSIAYTATKHGVTGLTKTAALDGRKYDIAVGQIDIGNAVTEMAARMARGVPQANGEIKPEPMMDVNIVGQSVLYMANLPPEANILFHTGDGHQDAFRGARLARSPCRPGPRPSAGWPRLASRPPGRPWRQTAACARIAVAGSLAPEAPRSSRRARHPVPPSGQSRIARRH
jgi:hypothetical protein